MVSKQGGQIIESAREARQAERGPTVRNTLVASTSLAILALMIIWFVFFRTQIRLYQLCVHIGGVGLTAK